MSELYFIVFWQSAIEEINGVYELIKSVKDWHEATTRGAPVGRVEQDQDGDLLQLGALDVSQQNFVFLLWGLAGVLEGLFRVLPHLYEA